MWYKCKGCINRRDNYERRREDRWASQMYLRLVRGGHVDTYDEGMKSFQEYLQMLKNYISLREYKNCRRVIARRSYCDKLGLQRIKFMLDSALGGRHD
jgi:hypothetical protein